MVATPIGNLADIGLRALQVLSMVDTVACEDTRHTAALLQGYGLHKPLLAPGMGRLRKPAAFTAATRRAPGSLTPGVPASLT